MRFLADMGISHRTVSYLLSAGHDAMHLHDGGLDTLSDTDILSKACRENRVVLTNDLDFGELLAASGAGEPTVIIFRLDNMTSANVNRHLQRIIDEFANSLAAGVIISVTEKRARIRRLPIA